MPWGGFGGLGFCGLGIYFSGGIGHRGLRFRVAILSMSALYCPCVPLIVPT